MDSNVTYRQLYERAMGSYRSSPVEEDYCKRHRAPGNKSLDSGCEFVIAMDDPSLKENCEWAK